MVYWKVVGTTLYLRGDNQTGYTLYPSTGGQIGGESHYDITSVVVENPISHIGSCISMFQDMHLTSLDLSLFGTSQVTDMTGMFSGCGASVIDLSSFDTSNVNFMSSMFQGCIELARLRIDNFTTRSNTDMSLMFYGCEELIVIECFNQFVANETSSNLFYGLTSLVGEQSKGGIPYNSSKISGAYAKINGGYFTYPKKTVSTSITSGNTITGNGTYDYGTEVEVVVTPNQENYQYIHEVTKNGILILNKDTIEEYSYKLSVTTDVNFVATCNTRNTHTLTASDQTYTIVGGGTYRYLDKPTLIANLGGGLVIFNGWYEGNTKLSSANPYKFVMPDRDLSLTIRVGSNPFTEEKVRQFCLQNGDGAVYKLAERNSNIFLSQPSGLGMAKSYTQSRYGNSASVESETYSFGTINGEVIFKGNNIYRDFNEFARFITNSPLTLWYKTEAGTYHVPVEMTSLSKSEIGTDKLLRCSISLNATGFWKDTESSSSASTSTIQLVNESDFEMGLEITLAKLNGTSFKNPRLKFSQDGNEYGIVALSSLNDQEFTQIKIDTRDGKQNIILENGDQVITNPLSYIDFSYADGTKQFPFPKLKKGYSTLEFVYDGVGVEGKSYVAIYDKEYCCV